MDAAGAQADLRDFEAAAFAEQHVILRHPDIVEAQMHVAARRMVVAEHVHRPEDLDAGRVLGHQNLRLLLARRRVRIGLHHHDHDLAAGIAETGDVIFFAVDHPFVADELCRGRDVLGVRRGDIRLGHGIGGADLAGEQRL